MLDVDGHELWIRKVMESVAKTVSKEEGGRRYVMWVVEESRDEGKMMVRVYELFKVKMVRMCFYLIDFPFTFWAIRIQR